MTECGGGSHRPDEAQETDTGREDGGRRLEAETSEDTRDQEGSQDTLVGTETCGWET